MSLKFRAPSNLSHCSLSSTPKEGHKNDKSPPLKSKFKPKNLTAHIFSKNKVHSDMNLDVSTSYNLDKSNELGVKWNLFKPAPKLKDLMTSPNKRLSKISSEQHNWTSKKTNLNRSINEKKKSRNLD